MDKPNESGNGCDPVADLLLNLSDEDSVDRSEVVEIIRTCRKCITAVQLSSQSWEELCQRLRRLAQWPSRSGVFSRMKQHCKKEILVPHLKALIGDADVCQSDRLQLMKTAILYCDSVLCAFDVERRYGGILPFHNLLHTTSVALHAAELLYNVNSTGSARYQVGSALALAGAFRHDTWMVYCRDQMYKRVPGTDFKLASEGRSAFDMRTGIRRLESEVCEHVGAESLQHVGISSATIVSNAELDSIEAAILKTVPYCGDFATMGTMTNSAEIATKKHSLELESRSKDTHLSLVPLPQFTEERVSYWCQYFENNPDELDRITSPNYFSTLAVGLADLGSCVQAGEAGTWVVEESVSLWAEENPDMASALCGDENSNCSLSDATMSLRGWLKGQINFARGRTTVMEERIWYPLLGCREALESKLLDRFDQRSLQVRQFISNFQRMYCTPDAMHPDIFVLRRHSQDGAKEFSSSSEAWSDAHLAQVCSDVLAARNNSPSIVTGEAFRDYVTRIHNEFAAISKSRPGRS